MVKKAQFATEYLVVTAFALFFISLTVYAIYTQIGHKTSELDVAQLNRAGNSIIESVNKLAYMAEKSRTTVKVMLPENLKKVYVENKKDLVFEYESGGDTGYLVFHSNSDFELSFENNNPGIRYIVLESKKNYVSGCLQVFKWNCNNVCEVSKGENASNSPSDCCKADCTGCSTSGGDESYLICDSDNINHTECDGHNGCILCFDNDGDGYGDPASPVCEYPEYDCDDGNASINPGADEDCWNGVDDDCDGQTDCADIDCGAVCNTPPSIEEVFISPAIAFADEDLVCMVNVTDGEQATLTVEYWWYNGTTEMFSGSRVGVAKNTFVLITTLGSGNTTTGETWNCTVRAFDGFDYSDYKSATKYINEPIIIAFVIANDVGERVAAFYADGSLTIKGDCSAVSDCLHPGDDAFIIQNALSETVAYIDSSGDMCVEESVCSGNDLNCNNPGDGSFIIQDITGMVVSYVNNTGGLCLRGELRENTPP